MGTRHVENAITIYIYMYVCMYVYKRGSRIGQANWEREHQQLALSMGTDEKVEFPSKNDLRSGESMMPDKDTRILTLEKQD